MTTTMSESTGALVVYESMYGNTRAVAEAIARGMGPAARVIDVSAATSTDARHADLLVVGAPTHLLGLSTPNTRDQARERAVEFGLTMMFTGPDGVREWLNRMDCGAGLSAAFTTCLDVGLPLADAAPGIAAGLRRQGRTLLADPRRFYVHQDETLYAGELDRAQAWGQELDRLAAEGLEPRFPARPIEADATGSGRRAV